MFRIIFAFLLLTALASCASEYDWQAKAKSVKETMAKENPAPDYSNNPVVPGPLNILKKQTVERSDPENLIIDVTDRSNTISLSDKTEIFKSRNAFEQFIRNNKSKFKEGKICIAAAGSTHIPAILHVMRALKKYDLRPELIVE